MTPDPSPGWATGDSTLSLSTSSLPLGAPGPPSYLGYMASSFAHLATCSSGRENRGRKSLHFHRRPHKTPQALLLATLVKHSSEKTRLPPLLLLLKLMESGRKTFCFSNPGFCQAHTRTGLEMAAAEERAWCAGEPPAPWSTQQALWGPRGW